MKTRKDKLERGYEWHLIFDYTPGLRCPFPIVLEGKRSKHDPVGHLSSNGKVHIYNTTIIEQLIRAGLRPRLPKSDQ